MIGTFVIVRTEHAGVHCGWLVECSQDGSCVRLRESRNIWRWKNGHTLREVSLYGDSLKEFTRISQPVENHILPGVIEIIECTEKATTNLRVSRWLN